MNYDIIFKTDDYLKQSKMGIHRKSKSQITQKQKPIEDISSSQIAQIEKFRKIQEKNNQKFLEEPDQNFGLIDNLEMYIKPNNEDDNTDTRNNAKFAEEMSNSLINKAPSHDVIFKPFKNDMMSRTKHNKNTHS